MNLVWNQKFDWFDCTSNDISNGASTVHSIMSSGKLVIFGFRFRGAICDDFRGSDSFSLTGSGVGSFGAGGGVGSFSGVGDFGGVFWRGGEDSFGGVDSFSGEGDFAAKGFKFDLKSFCSAFIFLRSSCSTVFVFTDFFSVEFRKSTCSPVVVLSSSCFSTFVFTP